MPFRSVRPGRALRRCGALAALALLLAWPAASCAAPSAELWERWTRHDPGSGRRVDHSDWQAFLQAHVERGPDGVNRVAYARAKEGEGGRRLDAYLRRLAEVRISEYARSEQLAFWINLYNALTVDVVLDHHPVDGIRDIDVSPGWFSDGPWGRKLVTIEGERLSLDDIEHRILRPVWRDPRIHYAVNCASVGCPNLRRDAFTGENADAMLTRAAREYVNHPRGVEVEDGELVLSRIYDWFQADFGGSEEGVLAHLRRHAEPALADRLADLEEIDGYRYDWSLNGLREE